MICQICGKSPRQAGIGRHLHSGKWRHRGPETKTTIRPNVQRWQGLLICSRCIRTLAKPPRKANAVNAA